MTPGWIYVLVNSSMPGLVKVGMTVRDPELRANELSGVTGVPTPFIVAYCRMVNDCSSAETAIHTILSKRGIRETQSREFFRAKASEIVDCVASYVDDAQESLPQATVFPAEESTWSHLLNEGWKHERGLDGYLQDYDAARPCYEDAVALGSLEAYEGLARAISYGRSPNEAAMRVLKAGSAAGSYFCWVDLARAYETQGNIPNATKCYERFIAARETQKQTELEDEVKLGFFAMSCGFFLKRNPSETNSKLVFAIFENVDYLRRILNDDPTSYSWKSELHYELAAWDRRYGQHGITQNLALL